MAEKNVYSLSGSEAAEKKAYEFAGDCFVIRDYDRQKSFSDFLPAVAGLCGIPMWVFYVNRGQGIAGFGSKDKSQPIMEFSPGSVALSRVNYNGFRTFVKIDGEFTEAFKVGEENAQRTMRVGMAGFSIEEIHYAKGYKLTVDYFGLPNEPFGALVRTVTLENLLKREVALELCDGLGQVIPYGITNRDQKEVGNLMRSFMLTENLDKNIPFFKVKSSTFDTTEMEEVKGTNFYLSFDEKGRLFPPVIDPEVIFGYDDSMSVPFGFTAYSVTELLRQQQFCEDKLPCGFTLLSRKLKGGESVKICTLVGSVGDLSFFDGRRDIFSFQYIKDKKRESVKLVSDMTGIIKTSTAYPIFDKYLEQSYLDNVLRGGYPLVLEAGGKGFVNYVYSRKHGDLERDYNWFVLSPEYYSCGEGNFRDVAQNRRNDVFFCPETGDYSIKQFFNLVQLDGGNPLVVTPPKYVFKGEAKRAAENAAEGKAAGELERLLQAPFSLGELAMLLEKCGKRLLKTQSQCEGDILSQCEQVQSAKFGEGYWVDHFTYLIDLVESYLKVYPERETELFFGSGDYKYFKSSAYVLPRHKRQVETRCGVRRVNSLLHVHTERDWAEDKAGNEIRATLAAKTLNLLLIKLASLDPENIGIDMETNKPGWNDAMNGMPAIFGSSFAEVTELLRVALVLSHALESAQRPVTILREQAQFLRGVARLLEGGLSPMEYYDRSNDLKEAFRESTNEYAAGEYEQIPYAEAKSFADAAARKLREAIAKAEQLYKGFYPTFISYEAAEYEKTADGIRVTRFKRKDLPLFAEGIARSYKIEGLRHKELYEKTKFTQIYDKTLKVYKTSESLENQDLSIGRIRVFSAGWLERESCFLHMTYKYMYGLLWAGLYEEFYGEIKTNFVPFMRPEVYGRSTLENSSFIVTDCKSDKRLVGRGFQPRLSGANAEVLSMWLEMFLGNRLFTVGAEGLCFTFKPTLSKDFFGASGTVRTRFMNAEIELVNERRLDCYRAAVERLEVTTDGETKTVRGGSLAQEDALALREGKIERVRVFIHD